MEDKHLIEHIYDKALDWKEEEGFAGEIIKLAFDNDCWNNQAVALALMLSSKSYKCCETESTILEVLNSFVTKKDGSNFKKFNKQEQKYVDIILNSGIYEKYKNMTESED